MKKFIILSIAALGLTSCNDFLEREPLDFGNESAYYKSANDLKIAANDFYGNLPTNSGYWGGLYSNDVNSDNQVATGLQAHLYEGEKKTDSGFWSFSNLRGINFFISKVEGNEANITGAPDLVKHYLGEAYFFRAYTNFSRLQSIGDMPIINELLPDDPAVLAEASRRQPRNVAARAIITDLDKAAENMLTDAPESGRVTRDAALLLKARVALYEATWEKYHANTCFVPGNAKWPGKEMWPDFNYNADTEINFFLDEAIKASDEVAQRRQLNSDYIGMFNRYEGTFGNDDEVILARYYQMGIINHSCTAYLKGGGGCNASRALVNTYLMDNGLPIYAENSGYHGDLTSYEEFMDRDTRLQKSVRAAGSFIESRFNEETQKYEPDTIFYHKPFLYASGSEKATTGYEIEKWVTHDPNQQKTSECYTTVPILRAAEAYLIYLEAYYERNGNLGGNCDTYWRALRHRAGVDEDYNKTIAATDLSKENDLAVWSKGVEVSPTLYNIRRERRCELIAEGLRLADLKRWRSLDMMRGYHPQGFNLWGGPIHEMYSSNELKPEIVSQASESDYVMPFRINSNSPVFNGYNFPKAHYLEPIPVMQLTLAVDADGKSTIYQNPGWSSTKGDALADYAGDYD